MNCGSTAGFVPLSAYIRFSCFVLAKGRSGQLSTILWRARGTVGFWATRPVGILCCPASPRPAALPCAAPTRTARGMSGFWTRQVFFHRFPGHTLHETGFQGPTSVCTLANNQERRAAVVPRINRGYTADTPRINRLSTGRQPHLLFLHRFSWDFVCPCF